MDSVSLADAEARLSELVDRAAAGETVCITKGGKPVAQLTAITRPRKPIDLAALRKLTEDIPRPDEPEGEFIRRMRDDSRY